MNRQLFTFLLLTISFTLFAQEYADKVKAKLQGDLFVTKMRLVSPMIGEEESKGGGVWGTTLKPIDYITQISAFSNDNEIFTIDTNPFLAHNPIFKFKIKNANVIHTAMLKIRYSSGDIKTKTFTIKNAGSKNRYTEKLSLKKSVDSRFWNAKSIDEAVKILYGTQKMIDDVIEVQVPEISSSGHIPISIKTDKDLESIVVLMSGNPRAAAAMVFIPSGKLQQFDIRVRPIYPIKVSKAKSGAYDVTTKTFITVIGKTRSGEIYKTERSSDQGICVNSGSGLEDYQIEELYEIQHR